MFVGAATGQPAARLIGHTKMKVNIGRIRLTSPWIDEETDMSGMLMHSEMIRHPYRQDGQLIWVWHLVDPKDVQHVPDFRPLA